MPTSRPVLKTCCLAILLVIACRSDKPRVPNPALLSDSVVPIDTTRAPVRPATPDQRAGLETALTSLAGLAANAELDLSHELDSDAHQRFVVQAERDLAINQTRLGPQPGMNMDPNYREAWKEAVTAMRYVRLVLGMDRLKRPNRKIPTAQIMVHVKAAQTAMEKMQ